MSPVRKYPWMTWSLVSALMFSAAYLAPMTPVGVPAGALWPYGYGEFRPWQLLTYAFVHRDLEHLASNLSLILVAGWVLERDWGGRLVLGLFLAGMVAGGLSALYVTSGRMSDGHGIGVTLGASASAMALAVSMMVGTLWELWRGRTKQRMAWMVVGLIILGAFFQEDIRHFGELPGPECASAHEAHLAGALAGILVLVWAGWRRIERAGRIW